MSGIRVSITIVDIRRFYKKYKMSFNSDSFLELRTGLYK